MIALWLALDAHAACVTTVVHLPANAVDAPDSPDPLAGPRRRWDDERVPCVRATLRPWTPPPPGPIGDGVTWVEQAWERHFGPMPRGAVGWTDTGLVSLPMARWLDADARTAEQDREQLVTDAQREKATDGLGPAGRDGVPAFTHFLGADPRYSDLWGQPAAVAALVDLAGAWWQQCTTTLAADPKVRATPARCTLQLGDLGWYGPTEPDPLGHFDHYRGICVDVRLFRTDASRYEAYWNQGDDRAAFADVRAYDRALTRAFTALAAEHIDDGDLFYNDPRVLDAVPTARPAPKHDDHVHLCFGAEAGMWPVGAPLRRPEVAP